MIFFIFFFLSHREFLWKFTRYLNIKIYKKNKKLKKNTEKIPNLKAEV